MNGNEYCYFIINANLFHIRREFCYAKLTAETVKVVIDN